MYNSQFFHIVLQYISMISGQLTVQLQNLLKEPNAVTLQSQTLEIKKEIAGGGIIDLIDGTTVRVDGICSFDKNILQSGRAFVFDKVAIMYATNAASGLEGSLAYVTAPPKELQNALLIINQNGKERFRMPVIDLTNLETSTKAVDEYTQLPAFAHLLDGENPITIQIKFPPTVSLSSAAKHYVYLRLNGLQTATTK